MNRSLGIFAAALLALAGGAAAAQPPDERLRAAALDRLLQAARTNDEPGMWAALSTVSRRRLGPTLAEFRQRGARGVRASVAPFVGGSYRVVLNADAVRGVGVVAIARKQYTFAAPLRRERGVWKVELDPAFTIEPVRPLPAERVVRRTQLAAEVVARRPIVSSAMWLDGVPFEARQYWSRDGERMSMWGEAPQPLRAGRHVVVAFAATRVEASANAWSFTVRGTGSGSRSRARTSP